MRKLFLFLAFLSFLFASPALCPLEFKATIPTNVVINEEGDVINIGLTAFQSGEFREVFRPTFVVYVKNVEISSGSDTSCCTGCTDKKPCVFRITADENGWAAINKTELSDSWQADVSSMVYVVYFPYYNLSANYNCQVASSLGLTGDYGNADTWIDKFSNLQSVSLSDGVVDDFPCFPSAAVLQPHLDHCPLILPEASIKDAEGNVLGTSAVIPAAAELASVPPTPPPSTISLSGGSLGDFSNAFLICASVVGILLAAAFMSGQNPFFWFTLEASRRTAYRSAGQTSFRSFTRQGYLFGTAAGSRIGKGLTAATNVYKAVAGWVAFAKAKAEKNTPEKPSAESQVPEATGSGSDQTEKGDGKVNKAKKATDEKPKTEKPTELEQDVEGQPQNAPAKGPGFLTRYMAAQRAAESASLLGLLSKIPGIGRAFAFLAKLKSTLYNKILFGNGRFTKKEFEALKAELKKEGVKDISEVMEVKDEGEGVVSIKFKKTPSFLLERAMIGGLTVGFAGTMIANIARVFLSPFVGASFASELVREGLPLPSLRRFAEFNKITVGKEFAQSLLQMNHEETLQGSSNTNVSGKVGTKLPRRNKHDGNLGETSESILSGKNEEVVTDEKGNKIMRVKDKEGNVIHEEEISEDSPEERQRVRQNALKKVVEATRQRAERAAQEAVAEVEGSFNRTIYLKKDDDSGEQVWTVRVQYQQNGETHTREISLGSTDELTEEQAHEKAKEVVAEVKEQTLDSAAASARFNVFQDAGLASTGTVGIGSASSEVRLQWGLSSDGNFRIEAVDSSGNILTSRTIAADELPSALGDGKSELIDSLLDDSATTLVEQGIRDELSGRDSPYVDIDIDPNSGARVMLSDGTEIASIRLEVDPNSGEYVFRDEDGRTLDTVSLSEVEDMTEEERQDFLKNKLNSLVEENADSFSQEINEVMTLSEVGDSSEISVAGQSLSLARDSYNVENGNIMLENGSLSYGNEDGEAYLEIKDNTSGQSFRLEGEGLRDSGLLERDDIGGDVDFAVVHGEGSSGTMEMKLKDGFGNDVGTAQITLEDGKIVGFEADAPETSSLEQLEKLYQAGLLDVEYSKGDVSFNLKKPEPQQMDLTLVSGLEGKTGQLPTIEIYTGTAQIEAAGSEGETTQAPTTLRIRVDRNEGKAYVDIGGQTEEVKIGEDDTIEQIEQKVEKTVGIDIQDLPKTPQEVRQEVPVSMDRYVLSLPPSTEAQQTSEAQPENTLRVDVIRGPKGEALSANIYRDGKLIGSRSLATGSPEELNKAVNDVVGTEVKLPETPTLTYSGEAHLSGPNQNQMEVENFFLNPVVVAPASTLYTFSTNPAMTANEETNITARNPMTDFSGAYVVISNPEDTTGKEAEIYYLGTSSYSTHTTLDLDKAEDRRRLRKLQEIRANENRQALEIETRTAADAITDHVSFFQKASQQLPLGQQLPSALASVGIPASGVPTEQTLRTFEELHRRVEESLNDEEREDLGRLDEQQKTAAKVISNPSSSKEVKAMAFLSLKMIQEQRAQLYRKAAERALDEQQMQEYQRLAEVIEENPHLRSLAMATAQFTAILRTFQNASEQLQSPNLQQSFQPVPQQEPQEFPSMVDTLITQLDDPKVQEFLGGEENVEQLRQRLEYLRWLLELRRNANQARAPKGELTTQSP